MTKQTIFSVIILVAVAAGAVWLTIWSKNYQAPQLNRPVVTNSDDSKYLVTKEPQTVSVAEDSYLLGIGGSYSQFSQADAAFNKKIADLVVTTIADFKKNADADYRARLEIEGDEFKKRFEGGPIYTLNWTTDVVQSNDNYISVLIHQEGYSGGAHGYRVATSFNYDVKNHKELTLGDVYSKGLAVASEEARAQLKAKFQVDGVLDESLRDMMNDGTDPGNPENFSVFTFIPSTVFVYFSEYQVGPYALGEQQITLSR